TGYQEKDKNKDKTGQNRARDWKEHDDTSLMCMALLLAEERFLKIKQVMEEEQNQPEEEPAVQSFTPYGNFSMIDDVEVLMKDIYTFLRKFSRIPFGVTPKVLLIAWERFGEIKHAFTDEHYQQEDIQELTSKLLEDGIFEDTCDVPVGEDSSTFDALNDHSEILSDSNNDDTSSDDNDFEDIDRLITNIESLNDNPTPNHEFKSPSSFPIPVTDSDSFFEKSDTSLSYSDKSLPKFEPFSDDTEETRSGSTTTHANNSLPEYDSFLLRFSPSRGGEIDFFQNAKDDDSFTFVIRTFLPFLTYPADSPLLLSTGSEDTIFDPGIST
ncbi:hypothetical protein Tco_1282786, partial [Tanacetum coccineum]